MRSFPLSLGRGILTLCLAATLLMFFVPLAFAAFDVEANPISGSTLEGDPDDYGSPQPAPSFLAYLAWFITIARFVWWRVIR